MTLVDYIPHGMVVAFAGLAGYIFKAHDERDNQRFGKFGDAVLQMNQKLDTAIAKQADNHAEILKLLIRQA